MLRNHGFWRCFLVATLVLTAAYAESSPPRAQSHWLPPHLSTERPDDVPRSTPSHQFDEQDLQTVLLNNPNTGHPVESLEELLSLLPAQLLSNFTLVYASRSPFRASISSDYPRVILFSDDARFVITFTGDPKSASANLIETMAFDDAHSEFQLHSHVLPAAQRANLQIPADAQNCALCHGNDARPILDSYPIWPGFYGSVFDNFPDDPLGRAELNKYTAFLKNTAKTGVYKQLRFPQDSPAAPYGDPRTFRRTELDADENDPLLPNSRLGMALTELNRKRIYRKLAAGPYFPKNEKRILAELLQCRGTKPASSFPLKLIDDQVRRENLDRLNRLDPSLEQVDHDLHDMQELFMEESLARLQDVAALAGVSRSDWSMALESDSVAFFDGILSGIYGKKNYYLTEDLIYEVLAHLAEREPAFKNYFRSDADYAHLGHSFGNRPNIGTALGACRLLFRVVSTQLQKHD